MSRYPHIIENGAGERLTFARLVQEPGGDRLEGETVVSPGTGPPMHVHFLQDEGFTVVEGRIGVRRGDGPHEFAGEGETLGQFLRGGQRPVDSSDPGARPAHCSTSASC